MHHHTSAAKGSTLVGSVSLNEKGWERSDFPILCETCLGPNPYIRMTKSPYDKECKICARPFTVFRWRPGKDARYKKTEVCQTCSKLKNVCQTCLLDLEYGLPVQVRDQELQDSVKIDMPSSDSNREWFAEQAEKRLSVNELPYGKAAPTETLLKLARTTPYYQRNRAHICSFFVKGNCTRGSECPYRHEMPTTGELANQNIKDRYYGVNDPVANKLLRQAQTSNDAQAPEDKTITTVYIGGMTPHLTEEDVRGVMYPYGEILSVRLVPRSLCAFVTYASRESAERAVKKLTGRLIIKGTRLNVMWGRPQGLASASEIPFTNQLEQSGSVIGQPIEGDPSAIPTTGPINFLGLPQFPAASSAVAPPTIFYPSMNPNALGSAPQKKAP
eukprot:c2782_g1_i1.p1 GENE.c2782_g1_i1~~c2782_g1_i1.p1  ORF type:complete len:387 (-),score=60.16 c2782_g1_i1:54-1214(-)